MTLSIPDLLTLAEDTQSAERARYEIDDLGNDGHLVYDNETGKDVYVYSQPNLVGRPRCARADCERFIARKANAAWAKVIAENLSTCTEWEEKVELMGEWYEVISEALLALCGGE